MSLDPAGQSRFLAFKILIVGIASASVLVPVSAAQRKANHASVWGPLFRSKVERCWKKPVGGDAGVEAAFKISLTRDGLLAEQPVAEKPVPQTTIRRIRRARFEPSTRANRINCQLNIMMSGSSSPRCFPKGTGKPPTTFSTLAALQSAEAADGDLD